MVPLWRSAPRALLQKKKLSGSISSDSIANSRLPVLNAIATGRTEKIKVNGKHLDVLEPVDM